MRHNGAVIVAYVVVGVLVVIAIALLAVGRLGELPPPSHDREPLDLPHAPVGAIDVDAVRFAVGLRGYRMDEVDEVLNRVSVDLTARDERIDQLVLALVSHGIALPSAPTPVEPPELSETPEIDPSDSDEAPDGTP